VQGQVKTGNFSKMGIDLVSDAVTKLLQLFMTYFRQDCCSIAKKDNGLMRNGRAQIVSRPASGYQGTCFS
jgi:hypothetical protein